MSWSQFKKEVGTKMNSYTFKDATEFAKYFTKKYDEAVKRGTDNITKNPVKKGNIEMMEASIISGMLQGIASTNPAISKQSYTTLGNGVKAYWTGAELQIIATPLIPAPGTIANIKTTKNIVTNPGKFSKDDMGPAKNTEVFLNTFISLADAHLATISGMAETISQYPPPAPPGKGIVMWAGYKVPKGNSDEVELPWDRIFNAGKNALIAYLKKQNVSDDVIKQGFGAGSGLINVIYNLKDYVHNDVVNRENINYFVSRETKLYFDGILINTFLSVIDTGFKTLSFKDRILFKAGRNIPSVKVRIKSAVGFALENVFDGMYEEVIIIRKETNIKYPPGYIADYLDALTGMSNYITSQETPLREAIFNKIMSL
jgi:hypothetical protein